MLLAAIEANPGAYYVNVHNANDMPGEIHSKLMSTTDPRPVDVPACTADRTPVEEIARSGGGIRPNGPVERAISSRACATSPARDPDVIGATATTCVPRWSRVTRKVAPRWPPSDEHRRPRGIPIACAHTSCSRSSRSRSLSRGDGDRETSCRALASTRRSRRPSSTSTRPAGRHRTRQQRRAVPRRASQPPGGARADVRSDDSSSAPRLGLPQRLGAVFDATPTRGRACWNGRCARRP